MQLEVLKDVFFFGNVEEVKSFVDGLKPRCITPTDKTVVEENGAISKLVYNSDHDSYISQNMKEYFISPKSGNMFPLSTKMEVEIAENSRTYIQPREGCTRGHYISREICSSAELNDYYVPECETDKFIPKDKFYYTIVYTDGDPDSLDCEYKYYYTERHPGITTYSNINGEIATDGTIIPAIVDERHPVLYQECLLTDIIDQSQHCRTILRKSYLKNHDAFFTCSNCGRIFTKVGNWNEEYPNKCKECAHPTMPIYNYHGWRDGYQPMLAEGEQITSSKMLFGTEVETAGHDENSRYVYPFRDIWHLERDASIPSFEMISQPMSWQFIKENKDRFESMFTDLMSHDQHSHDTSSCGLHIHVSRRAFKSDKAILRTIAIVNGLQKNMELFARRKNSHYYEYSPIMQNFNYGYLRDDVDHTGHCCSVNTANCDADKNTIEFRIFRGTLNVTTYLATIEIVKNIVEVANDETKIFVKFGDLLHGDFIPDYVEQRKTHGINFDENASVDFSFAELSDALDKLRDRHLTTDEFMSVSARVANHYETASANA